MIRKFTPLLLLLAVVLSLTALAQSTSAASTPAAATPTKVGIINIQQAILASHEGQRDFEVLQKKFEPKQVELQNLGKEVDNLKQQLQTQGDKLNDEARANLVKTIETKQKAFQRSYEDAQNDVQAQQGEFFNRIGQKIMVVLDKYAKANGFALILDVSNPQSPVLWANPAATDVTRAVVDAYNVQSGVPAPPPPAPGAARSGASTTRPATPPAPRKPATGTPPK